METYKYREQNRTEVCHRYGKNRAGQEAAPPAHDTNAAAAPPAPAPPPADTGVKDSTKTAAAVGELNMLASLIGAQPANHEENFKLENLFSANVFAKEPKVRSAEVIQIDGAAPSEYHAGLDSVRQQMEGVGGPPLPGPGDDDLLDLLDNAS